MRSRLTLVAVAVVTLAANVVGTVNAAPRHDHGLTITATPNPVNAGDGVLIDGQLSGPDQGGQTITLYHHLAGWDRGYTRVSSTLTDSTGFYEFPRAEGVVLTNRSWFVRGPNGTHSDVIHEAVTALVSLQAQTTSVDTGQPVLFSGAVTPDHSGEPVYLQEQIGSGDDWRTLEQGTLGPGSQYSITHRWGRPGVHDVRVLFRGDVRNAAGASDPITVEVQQRQVPDFTINSSQPITPFGSTVMISGTLDMSGTTAPEPDTPVQLWGRTASSGGFAVLGNTTTDSQGGYSFTQANEIYNTLYFVSTLPSHGVKARRTALLRQGVQDALSLQASPTNVLAGQPVTFAGTVLPDKAGENVYLQRRGKDGEWHDVGVEVIRRDSTYQFTRRFGNPGTFTFRTRILSDGRNVGTRSAPATVTVTLPPPPSGSA